MASRRVPLALAGLLALCAANGALAATPSWAGTSHYYLWACNSTVRAEHLRAMRAGGLKVRARLPGHPLAARSCACGWHGSACCESLR
jgi:hypothetical protein